MIQRMKKEICSLHANIMPFYTRDLSIHIFWYPWDWWIGMEVLIGYVSHFPIPLNDFYVQLIKM